MMDQQGGTGPLQAYRGSNSSKDIADYPEGVKDPHESVLANSVNAANFDLLQKIKPRDLVLEVGCGATSYLFAHLPVAVRWEGIDVYEWDSRGRKCIATRLGSVHAIPFANEWFDWVLANQSIEHWYEYGVTLEEGLAEIGRVLRVGGHAHLNFPFHLHGHPAFVRGDGDSILRAIGPDTWEIVEIISFYDSTEPEYAGWRRCGFPDVYVKRKKGVKSSYVIELVLKKISANQDQRPANPTERPLVLKPRLSAAQMALAHGAYVFLWKSVRKVLGGKARAEFAVLPDEQ